MTKLGGALFLLSLAFARLGSGAIERQDLRVRSLASDEAPLFAELDPRETGLSDFVNDYGSSDVWGRRWREYILGTIGVGIALGDIDGDGYPDLFVASKDEESRLYRNIGDMKFVDISVQSGFVDSEFPATGCSFADVDNDGDLDLYLCYVRGGNQLWINDGTGRFEEKAEEWGVAIKSGCTMASFADFDRDGDLDFYLQNNLVNDGHAFEKLSDQLFENRGTHFVEITESAGIEGAGHGHSATWWDFDEDGYPDIYVANDFDTPDKLYRNNGDKTFTDMIASVASQTPYYSMGADFGDIDNDGHSDYWVADMAPTSRKQYLRTIGSHQHLYAGENDAPPHQYAKNALLLKLDEKRFAEIAYLAGLAETDWTWAARLVDLNNDGWLDAFATNGMLRSFHDGDLGAKQNKLGGSNWMLRAFRNEAVLKERNLAFENKGELRFEGREKEWGLGKMGVSFGVAFGDLDRDGDIDLVLNNYQEPVSVFRNDETEGNRLTIRLKGVSSNAYGIGAKLVLTSGELRQVKELYPMRGYMSTDEPLMHFGVGERSHVDRLEIHWPSGAYQKFEDLEVNSHYVVTESELERDDVSKENSRTLFRRAELDFPSEAFRKEARFADFNQQPLLPFPESRLGGDVSLVDVNQDGLLDIVLAGARGQETAVFVNRGSGKFEYIHNIDFEADFGCEDWDLEVADWDGDGRPDLFVASGGVESPEGDAFYEDRLYLNDGDGYFSRDFDTPISNARNSSSTLRVVDYDGDGDLDVFTGTRTIPSRYPNSEAPALWANGQGGLVEALASMNTGLDEARRLSDVAWSDLDGDGDLDLTLALEWGAIEVWRNRDGRLERDQKGLPPQENFGLWSCVEVVDLDGDGRKDIVAGNLGLNTSYRASASVPISLWHGESEEGGVALFETARENDEEVFRVEKWRMERAFPQRSLSSMSYEEFANSSLGDVFPDLEQQGYQRLLINELRSCVFWQREDGTFEKQALPQFAQTGKAMAMKLVDFDEDGDVDIIMSLEPVSPAPWSERHERGHLAVLVNKGSGAWEPLSAWESGLAFDGNPRGIAWGNLLGDERPELLVNLSEGAPLVFTLSD